MKQSLNLFISFLKYRKIILSQFDKKILNDDDSKEALVTSIDLLFDHVLLDIENALKSQKKEKEDFEKDRTKLEFFEYDNTLKVFRKKIKLSETKFNYFKNFKCCFLILKLIDLKINDQLSKENFFSIVSGLDHKTNIFYYNISYQLYLYFYCCDISNLTHNLLYIVNDLIDFRVLNICTNFNNDYFKIISFIPTFYRDNYADTLLEMLQ